MLHHFRVHVAFVGEELAAVRAFRKHLAWYAHGLHGASASRNEANRLERAEEVEAAVLRFFTRADHENSANETTTSTTAPRWGERQPSA